MMLIHCFMYIVPHIVGGFCGGLCFVMHYFVTFLALQSS